MSEEKELMGEDALARIQISWRCEPGDLVAYTAVSHLGAAKALEIMQDTGSAPASVLDELCQVLRETGYTRPEQALRQGRERWQARGEGPAARETLTRMRQIGAVYVTPESASWPQQLGDLGPGEPLGLWVRAPGADPGELLRRLEALVSSVAVVGSRSATEYGLRCAEWIASECSGLGRSVVSGGAFGIDRQAHATALAAPARAPGAVPTAAILAGGMDRYYPAAHEPLFLKIMERGLLIGESHPGTAPTRWRFLQRNRLIAAMTTAVVVAEARSRSGAQSTANHALAIGREVGAVPGSVFSGASEGCHLLIRESGASIISRSEDLRALLGLAAGPGADADQRPTDRMDEVQLAVYEATPVRRPAEAASIAAAAGVAVRRAQAVLAEFETQDLVRRSEGRWVRQSAAASHGRMG